MIAAGIDLSLTATGLAIVDTDDRLVIEVATVVSKPGPDRMRLTDRAERLDAITTAIAEFTEDADVAAIEGPAVAARNAGSGHDRSGLWWRVVQTLLDSGITVVEIAPAARAKYATGSGAAGKDKVLLAVERRWPHAHASNNNEADAVALVSIAARLAGAPIEDSMPAANLAALTKYPTLNHLKGHM